MKQVDLTGALPKRPGSRISFLTVHRSGNYTGIKSKGSLESGIGFLRETKKGGLVKFKNGTARWYLSSTNTLTRAVSQIRRDYGVKCPVNGWETVRCKVYNYTTPEELIEALKFINT